MPRVAQRTCDLIADGGLERHEQVLVCGAGGAVEAGGAVAEGVEARGRRLAGGVAAAAAQARHAAGTLLNVQRNQRRLRPCRVVEIVCRPIIRGVRWSGRALNRQDVQADVPEGAIGLQTETQFGWVGLGACRRPLPLHL